MKNLFKKGISMILVCLMLLSAVTAFAARLTENPMVFVIGDSTAASYGESESTLSGWGQVLYNFFTDSYMVNDCAVSGASSRSFYNNYWNSIKAQIKKGDYVLIQFGHNDSKPDGTDSENLDDAAATIGRYTDPAGDKDTEGSFKWYLNKYVTDIEEAGATPILVTSIERRGDAYKAAENSQLYAWVTAMKEFAAEENKAIINIWDDFRAKIVSDCPSSSTKHPWFTSYTGLSGTDDTHLTRTGAMETSRMFAKKLKASSIALKSYLKTSLDSVVFEELQEKILEDFEDAAEGIMSVYNGWVVGGTYSNEKTPRVQVVYEDEAKTNKVLNFYRDGSQNTGIDSAPMNVIYTLKSAIGADTPDEVEESERYVKFSYKFRSEINGAGFPITINGKGFQLNPYPDSRFFFYYDYGKHNKYIESGELPTDKWYTFEVYYDLKLQKATLLIDGTRHFTEVDCATSKIDTIKIQPTRCSKATENHTWSYKVDDIELTTIDEATYCDYVGKLPDESYLIRETFNLYEAGTRLGASWNEWTIDNSKNAVSMINITEDPLNSSNKVLAFQRTGVPNGINTMSRTFTDALDNGFYELRFKTLKHTESDNVFELTIKDGETSLDSSNVAKADGWKISIDYNNGIVVIPNVASTTYSTSYTFNREGESITKDQWYDLRFIFDLTSDTGLVSLFIDGECVAENIAPPNKSNVIAERYNKGKIKSITMGLNRTIGSTIIKYKEGTTTRIENVDYSGNGTPIADVKFDDLVLKSVVTKPEAVVYSGNSITSVKIKSERMPKANEKMLVAVYSVQGESEILKSVSECEAVEYGSTALSLNNPLPVADGDVIKVFFWNMKNLQPIDFLKAEK